MLCSWVSSTPFLWKFLSSFPPSDLGSFGARRPVAPWTDSQLGLLSDGSLLIRPRLNILIAKLQEPCCVLSTSCGEVRMSLSHIENAW